MTVAPTRFFHEIYGNVHELPDRGPFRYESELQEFFEKHLHTLTGVVFLASEYPTGRRHGRRIDTLGIDGAGRPVVVEYKRRQDQNVINQGLDYLAWLEDHQAEFRELVRNKLGDGRVTDINFGASRLLCIAEGFPRQDQIAAETNRRPIELLRYRRYGDAYVALEWMYGAAPEPVPPPDIPPTPPERQNARPGAENKYLRPFLSGGGEADPRKRVGDPDYSIYEPWDKTSKGSRALFHELRKLVESMGSVRTDAHKTVITFSCTTGDRSRVVAYVRVRVQSGLRVHIDGKHLSAIPLEDGFTRPIDRGYRQIVIRDREDVRRAEPLLRAVYAAVDGEEHAKSQATEPLKRVTREEFLESCDDNGSAILVPLATGGDAASDLPAILFEDLGGLIYDLPAAPAAALTGDDLAEIMFTSGTTGDAKGVMLTHGNLMANVHAMQQVIPGDASFRMLSLLPLSHMFEQMGSLFAGLGCGASITFVTSRQPAILLKTMQERKINMMLLVPQALDLFMKSIEREVANRGKAARLGAADEAGAPAAGGAAAAAVPPGARARRRPPAHSWCRGGAALDQELGEKWHLLGVSVLQGYGATEASPVISCHSLTEARFDSVGPAGARRRGAHLRGRRDPGARPQHHRRLLAGAGADRGGVRRRLVQDRGHRLHRRCRAPAHPRAGEGDDHAGTYIGECPRGGGGSSSSLTTR